MQINPPNNVQVITLGVKCLGCGHTWGIRLDIYGEDIPEHRYVCEICRKAEIPVPESIGV